MFIRFCTSAALLLAATTSALAAEPSLRIHFGDLDLSRPSGAATLQGRIERAVRQACGRATVGDLNTQQETRRCRQQVLASVAPRRDALLAASAPSGSRRLAAADIR